MTNLVFLCCNVNAKQTVKNLSFEVCYLRHALRAAYV